MTRMYQQLAREGKCGAKVHRRTPWGMKRGTVAATRAMYCGAPADPQFWLDCSEDTDEHARLPLADMPLVQLSYCREHHLFVPPWMEQEIARRLQTEAGAMRPGGQRTEYERAVSMYREAVDAVEHAQQRRNQAADVRARLWRAAGLPWDAAWPTDNRQLGEVGVWYLLCEEALTQSRLWRDEQLANVRRLRAEGAHKATA